MRPSWKLYALECLYLLICNIAACVAAMVQCIGKSYQGEHSSFIFRGSTYSYNPFAYILGLVLFIGALYAGYRLILRRTMDEFGMAGALYVVVWLVIAAVFAVVMVIADLFERYGDCIRIDASMSSEELEELEASTAVDGYLTLANSANKEFYNYKPDGSLLTFTDYMSNRGSDKAASRGATLAIAAGLGAAILVLAYVLRRQNGRVAVLADGRQSVRGTYSDAEIEALAKCVGGDVSEEGRMRIFEAYERETGKTPR